MPFSITKLAHVEIRVTNLERARHFYSELLGMVETESDPNRIYLRGLEGREHHSLVLRKAESPGLGHFAFRVSDPDDLDRLHEFYTGLHLPIQKIPSGFEKGQSEALRVQDPLGFPVEFYHEMEEVPRELQAFHKHRGAHPLRVDHVNVQVPDVQKGYDYYVNELGFRVSEYTVTEDEKLWAVWLNRKQDVHDIAIMNGTGPRLHHFALFAQDAMSVIRTCDVVAGADMEATIERGPGRHGLSNALFVYLRDEDKNRVEVYTSDYMIPDPDWKPIRWTLQDRKRQTFWGHIPPASWFEEASTVESITDGTLIKPTPTLMKDRPSFVT